MTKKHPILVVDDEIYNLDAIKRTFRDAYTIFSTSDPKEAIRIISNEKLHLILSDQRMPEMSGIELLKVALEKQPEAIRIILTAYTDVEDMIDAINIAQVYRYITKPWDPEDLKLSVKRALEHYAQVQTNLKLNEELRLKNLQLEKQNEELRSLDKLKNQFIMVVGHELRTPISIAKTGLELVSEEYENQPENPYRAVIKSAVEAVERLNEIISDVLDVLFIESGEIEVKKYNINLGKLMDEVIQHFSGLFSQRAIQLQNLIPSDFEIYADKRRLRQVLEHLVTNALKFTPDSGSVRLKAEKKENEVEISISDTGIGIPKEELEKIFDRFHTLSNPMHHSTGKTKFMGGGSGLGLTICRGLIQAQGGKIWAESGGENQGTVVHFILPVRPANEPDNVK